jgi:hypothetical protein
MIRVCVVGEGQTEQIFVEEVLQPVLVHQSVDIHARLINTSSSVRGGGLTYSRVKRYLMNTLKEDQHVFVTTLFDLYGLNKTFPGFEESFAIKHAHEKAKYLEKMLQQDIANTLEIDIQQRFKPHIQPYEFEALLFSDIAQLTQQEIKWENETSKLIKIREQYSSPEDINGGAKTHPSARLEQILGKKYRKTLHGPQTCLMIGLEKIRQACPHFAEWYQMLLELPK